MSDICTEAGAVVARPHRTLTYLVDTSVWIEAQKPRPRPKGLLLKKLSAEGAARWP